jgi:osmotically-inducible protein OsmY
MYLLDPRGGGRRRALLRDQMIKGGRRLGMIADKRSRDLANRLRGAVAEGRASMRDRDISDDVLAERVRAQLGHVLSHPGGIEILAENGSVIIRGPVLLGELEKVREKLSRTRGVRSFDLELREVSRSEAESIPELQGTSRWQRKTGRAS